MNQNFKIVIPMAGYGSRMRPHTWVHPKPLLPLAGRTVLDYSLDQFKTLPGVENAEYVFIISPNQGEQIQEYMAAVHPEKKVHFVLQSEMRGQAHAMWLARELLTGPMLMSFSDTLIEPDLSLLPVEEADAVAWVKPVEDPRRFGVIELDENGWATRLVEKPKEMTNNLVLVGFYYFKQGEKLIEAIEEQMRRGKHLNGEFYLADAVNVLLESGIRMRKEQISIWLDAGIPSAVLETNRYMLENRCGEGKLPAAKPGVAIIPPVSIAEDVNLENVIVGPHVSLGKGCQLKNVIIRDSVVDEFAVIENIIIEGSLIGQRVFLRGKEQHLNVGDDSQVGL
jgi:glucose-1-phosphate thymidylyltransferase